MEDRKQFFQLPTIIGKGINYLRSLERASELCFRAQRCSRDSSSGKVSEWEIFESVRRYSPWPQDSTQHAGAVLRTVTAPACTAPKPSTFVDKLVTFVLISFDSWMVHSFLLPFESFDTHFVSRLQDRKICACIVHFKSSCREQ
jgi:hypothetical protein